MSERGIINPNGYRFKIPYFLYKRLDLRDCKAKYQVPFTIDFGGDYFLKKLSLRWDAFSGTIVSDDATEGMPEPIVLEQKFVNLNDAYQGSPGHAGTELDMFDIADWQALINAQVSSPGFDVTMYGIGNYYDPTGTANLKFNHNGVINYYRPYLPWVNGPWRIQTNVPNFFQGSCYLTGGIISCFDTVTGYAVVFDSLLNQSPHLDNMWISADILRLQAGAEMHGCFFSGRIFENAGTNYHDSIIMVDELNGGGAQMYNCAFFYLSKEATVLPTDFHNCFYPSYSPTLVPGLPVWDEPDKTLFDISSIVRGNIPDAVFLGSPPYTTYTMGLFGELRFGIGTGYFVNNINTLPGEIKASLRKMSSHFKYFEEIPPVVFSSPCDNYDCVASVSLLPVDNDILSMSVKGSRILSQKSFNWLIENGGTVVVDIIKEPGVAPYPEFVDIVLQGYYIDSTFIPKRD